MWTLDDIEIYDHTGARQDWAWLRARYGDVQVHLASEAALAPQGSAQGGDKAPVLRLERILESANGHSLIAGPDAPCAIIVKAVDEAGRPLPNVAFCWWWPDAPPHKAPGWGYDRCVAGLTNAEGAVGHPMGAGAAYSPPGGGPHANWPLGGQGDLVTGLGWLAGTDHSHLDLLYRRVVPAAPPPAGDELTGLVREIRDLVRDIHDHLHPRPVPVGPPAVETAG